MFHIFCFLLFVSLPCSAVPVLTNGFANGQQQQQQQRMRYAPHSSPNPPAPAFGPPGGNMAGAPHPPPGQQQGKPMSGPGGGPGGVGPPPAPGMARSPNAQSLVQQGAQQGVHTQTQSQLAASGQMCRSKAECMSGYCQMNKAGDVGFCDEAVDTGMHFKEEDKKKVVAEITEDHKSFGEVSRKYKLKATTLFEWLERISEEPEEKANTDTHHAKRQTQTGHAGVAGVGAKNQINEPLQPLSQ